MRRRIAIAGLGAAARQIHLPAYAKLADLEVVGGFDPAVGAAKFPFPLYGSLEELLDQTSPDILSAVAPTAHHHEIVRKGLLAGCHVLCEKPFMASMQEADEITALARELARAFAEPGVTAVFGSYDDRPPARNFLSQYKNLVHHFYHHRGRREASTFWAGCGGVRRLAFLEAGGFDVARYTRPSIEDIELGYRLRAAGGRILLWPGLQGTHLKEWRLLNLLHTEIFCRAIPWSRLMLSRTGLVDDLNVGVTERLRAALAGAFVAGSVASLHPAVPGWVALVMLGAIALANFSLLLLFYRRKGPLFALGGLLFHQVYYLYSSAAFAWCWAERLKARYLVR